MRCSLNNRLEAVRQPSNERLLKFVNNQIWQSLGDKHGSVKLSGLCAAFRPVYASVALPFLWLVMRNISKKHAFHQAVLVVMSCVCHRLTSDYICCVKAEIGTRFNIFALFPFKKRILNKNILCQEM